MKSFFSLILIAALMLTLQYCTETENSATVKKVQFAFNTRSSAEDGARLSAVALPSNASLMVTIENSAGETVLDHHMIDLLKVGDRYMSKPIDLIAGNYNLVDFMIVNNGDEVLYAAPKHGSPLASAVTTPVPFSFYVSKDNVSNISVEVVDVQGSTPEAFGYASFDISIKEGLPLQVAVMAPVDDGYDLVSADAWLLKDNDTIASLRLNAKVNTVFINEADSRTTLRMVVKTDGYHPEQRMIEYKYLIERLNGKPFTIMLRRDTEPKWASYFIYFDVIVDTIDPSEGPRWILEDYAEYYPDIPELPEYTGPFRIQDHDYIKVTIDNERVDIYDEQENIHGFGEPWEFVINEHCRGRGPYGDVIDIIGGNGYVDYSENKPILHLNLEQDYQFFFVNFGCYFIDYAVAVLYTPEDYLSDVTIDLSDEDGHQEFYMKDSTLKVTVSPIPSWETDI